MAIRRNLTLRGLALVAILSLAWGCTFPGGEQAGEQATPAHDLLIEPASSSPEDSSTPARATEAALPAVDSNAPTGEQPAPAGDPPGGPEEMILYPAESVAYEKYLDVIRGRPGLADSAVVEATITSLLKSEICPYQEETCRIEPYPNDWGVVRVDRILEYRPYGAQAGEPITEQPGQAPASGGETTAGSTGAEEQPKLGNYEPLQPGQEVETQFVLTARSAKVRWVATLGSEGMEAPQSSSGGDPEQTAGQQIGPGIPTFEPIPKEGGAFVFHILARDSTQSGEMALPGLAVGSRFRATVHYNGTLYVQGYEVIP